MSASTSTVTDEMMELDNQLSQLLENMTLKGAWNVVANVENDKLVSSSHAITSNAHDGLSFDGMDCGTDMQESYLPDGLDLEQAKERQPSSKSTASEARPCGCGLLQYIQSQICSDQFATTGGDYLETVFIHRDLFRAYPQGHQECVIVFNDLVKVLEQRAWRVDRESDAEAAAAFRQEAWLIANASTFLVIR